MLEMLTTTFIAGFAVVVMCGHVMLFKAMMHRD
jgi:hypothetical protein